MPGNTRPTGEGHAQRRRQCSPASTRSVVSRVVNGDPKLSGGARRPGGACRRPSTSSATGPTPPRARPPHRAGVHVRPVHPRLRQPGCTPRSSKGAEAGGRPARLRPDDGEFGRACAFGLAHYLDLLGQGPGPTGCCFAGGGVGLRARTAARLQSAVGCWSTRRSPGSHRYVILDDERGQPPRRRPTSSLSATGASPHVAGPESADTARRRRAGVPVGDGKGAGP